MPKATPSAKAPGTPGKKLQQHQTRRFYWSGYHTTRWRKRREAHFDQYPFCVKCEETGQLVDAKYLDHKRTIEDGCDPWDETNWQGLCESCDARKRGQTKRLRQ